MSRCTIPFACTAASPEQIPLAIAITRARLQPSVGVHQVPERLALDELHDQERTSVVDDDVEHRDDVRVVHPREGARLTSESSLRGRVLHGGRRQPLDRDLAAQLQVRRDEHLRHPARAERAIESVAAGDDLVRVDRSAVGPRGGLHPGRLPDPTASEPWAPAHLRRGRED